MGILFSYLAIALIDIFVMKELRLNNNVCIVFVISFMELMNNM